ncbi:MAG: hypothetical protein JZU65_22100 [Chlorobium sp.]|nr:hypothetical protein [Chlorobium sp.]
MASSLSDISKTFRLPIEFLTAMKKDGLIGDVVEDREIPWFVLIGLSEKEKTALIKAEKPKPIDVYISKVYSNKKPGQKIIVDDLMIILRNKFGVAINNTLKSRIGKIRANVDNTKRYQAKKG